MYECNITFNDNGEVTMTYPHKEYEFTHIMKYIKKLRKMAKKGYIISYNISENEITYIATNKIHGLYKFKINKKQDYITEVEIFTIENILKNSCGKQRIEDFNIKWTLFANNFNRYYNHEIRFPTILTSVIFGILSSIISFYDITVSLLIVGSITGLNLSIIGYSIIGSYLFSQKEYATNTFEMPLKDYLKSNNVSRLIEETKGKKQSIAESLKDEIKSLSTEINILLEKLSEKEQLDFKQVIQEKIKEFQDKVNSIINSGNNQDSLEFQMLAANFIVFLESIKNTLLKKVETTQYFNDLNNFFEEKNTDLVPKRTKN